MCIDKLLIYVWRNDSLKILNLKKKEEKCNFRIGI